nr:MAG TPA: hypothetical protein [Caudoviricetes sp.]
MIKWPKTKERKKQGQSLTRSVLQRLVSWRRTADGKRCVFKAIPV